MTSPSVGAIRALFRYRSLSRAAISWAPRIGVRVVGVRGDGAEISGTQVINAPDQLELVRVRLIWTHVAIAGRLSEGPP